MTFPLLPFKRDGSYAYHHDGVTVQVLAVVDLLKHGSISPKIEHELKLDAEKMGRQADVRRVQYLGKARYDLEIGGIKRAGQPLDLLQSVLVVTASKDIVTISSLPLRAHKRGVDVLLVADHRSNLSEDRSGKARAALSALVAAGIDVRTTAAFAIHHHKVVIADRATVELGSFNYSDAAARKNSENVFVNWGNPQLAAEYLRHFERNFRTSKRLRGEALSQTSAG